MHPRWASTEEIAGYFGTRASGHETDALRAEIEQHLHDSHPDKTGGDFESESQRIRFYELQDALRFLEIHSEPTALVPRDDATSLLAALVNETKSLATRVVSQDNRSERRSLEAHIRSGLRRQTLIPRFTSGMFWSVTTALLAFMGLLKNHPVLGALNSNVYAKITLAAAWLISGSLFLIFWWREQLTEKRIDYLMSEECLVETFDSLCRTATWTDDESAGTFTTSDFADCLNEEATYGLSWFRKLVRGKREIDPTAATDVARTHLTVLEERKAVLRLMEPSASPKFQIHPDILTPLKERHEDNKRRQREKAGQEKAEKETEQNSPETET